MKTSTSVDPSLAERLRTDFLLDLPEENVPWRKSWPDCPHCQQLALSNERKPACPQDGTIDDYTHVCSFCGRRWKQYILLYHIWRHVTDKAEWQAIRREQILKDAGFSF